MGLCPLRLPPDRGRSRCRSDRILGGPVRPLHGPAGHAGVRNRCPAHARDVGVLDPVRVLVPTPRRLRIRVARRGAVLGVGAVDRRLGLPGRRRGLRQSARVRSRSAGGGGTHWAMWLRSRRQKCARPAVRPAGRTEPAPTPDCLSRQRPGPSGGGDATRRWREPLPLVLRCSPWAGHRPARTSVSRPHPETRPVAAPHPPRCRRGGW